MLKWLKVRAHSAHQDELTLSLNTTQLRDKSEAILNFQTLSLHTVQEIAPLAEKYKEATLRDFCGDFILAHMTLRN